MIHFKKFLSTGLFVLILSSCTGSPVSFKVDGVELSVFDDRFVVLNHQNSPLYFNAMDRNLSVRAIWSPNPDNYIGPMQRKVFNYDEVSGYSDGNKVNFHYWYKKEFDPDLIKLIVIDTSARKIEKMY